MEGKIAALVVAAGSGSRVGGELPKQYRRVAGRSLLAHAIDRLGDERIDMVQVVIGEGQEALFRETVGDRSLSSPVLGGATRQQSVRNGLEALAARGDVGAVLIHDAARPFLPAEVIDRLIEALDAADGAVPVLPVVDSLAERTEMLGAAVPREGLVRVQTPQAFRFDAILEAHRQWQGASDATDDAQVARAAGFEIAVVAGSRSLEKLTYEEDFMRAEQRLSATLISRTGLGFDVHRFDEGEELWLGGLLIPHDKGLSGHSDADVVLHALTDALLGAIGEGDIGQHFPPSDPQWRGAPSSRFLDHARALIDGRGGRIDHVDITVICEQPKIGPHRDAMRRSVADLLRLPLARVSIKATTTERLGFTGRGEGIAAQAVATVRVPEEA
ncbi:bifunctional 2-C-methyl-D-erythritol 4-phosphate cytidylyltransferase/2-C-methyl-D-erythritol 2,4-cyclodiphosphate synthase [Sphingosinicella humi]|uniref:Bifunctional enzyme IspD/IspF n=1 Tax=Allosphingosinicella humi TaxID=2068657 RepID=A0A2U2IYW7_9SPHN|nr:bifunctional 2-C-methyl-D-erythritol 4-phosphate cytidylyltransferase/2-C-methyl-D-erythritol 2,4-cyclodiphosphate synthase [Sphingosinicella humi]PWG01231.1 bifunctional 2-C-methyl-D-erythritol 4-phosphate cytidylyltransferase/2-C-methyl-D-erythritol 2,4-cyclodiphosphate synthase [Sphingosinicella humi]